MAQTLSVKCGPGIPRFPFERQPKRYITDAPVEVQSTPYYRRALKDGDLVLANGAAVTSTVTDAAAPLSVGRSPKAKDKPAAAETAKDDSHE